MSDRIDYTPAPTIREFIRHYDRGALFYNWIVGPVGSSKTTGIFFKLIYMAKLQQPSADGIRRSRAVIVRNTMPQLKDTTITSWFYWFKHGQAGTWHETDKKFVLRYDDVECEVLFRPLDTPQDVARVLSLEVTFAIIDEFVQIPQQIIDALSARLGRYPSARDGGATNWGMWGASNPDTEDNWWFDHLHDEANVVQYRLGMSEDDITRTYAKLQKPVPNARYYLQPSGFAPDAENLENLPGGRGYYENQAKGKSEAWIKQFLEAEWGFSIEGQPVVGSFKTDLHVAKSPLKFNPHLKLAIGFDPGLGGSAFTFGQEDDHGRLIVLGELINKGWGAERLAKEQLLPYVRRRFPDADVVLVPDPAAANRTMTDERTVVDVLKKYFPVSIEGNNRLPLRLNAIEHYTTRLTEMGPALLIDPTECPVLVRALKGGWRFELDQKRGVARGAQPEKNQYSHPGDSFGYLARYFHREVERQQKRKRLGAAPVAHVSTYHMR